MTTILSFLPVLGSFPLPLAEFGPWGLGPILIPLAGISLGLAGIIFGSLDKMQKRRLRHELLRVALEKGQPLPTELLDEPTARSHRDDRRSGLLALAVGVALYLFLSALVPEPGVKWVALVPGFVGLALLFNWALERRADNGQKSP
jgi:membrane associated rhomboid family serine protease